MVIAAVVELKAIGNEEDRLIEGEFHRARRTVQHRALSRHREQQLGMCRGWDRRQPERQGQRQGQRCEHQPEDPTEPGLAG